MVSTERAPTSVASDAVWSGLAMRLHSTARPYVFYHLLARPATLATADRLLVWSRWRWVAGQRVPADDRLLDGRSAVPSWDLDKQPFVFVDAFVSQCGDLPTTSTWTTASPTDAISYLFILGAGEPAHATFMRFLFCPA